MKFEMKSLVIAAALVATGVANAATITATVGTPVYVTDPAGSGREAELKITSGAGALRFSNGGIQDNGLLANGNRPTVVGGLVGALNTGKVTLTAVDGASVLAGATTTSTPGQVTFVNNRKARGLVSISANVINLQADDQTGVIGVVGSQGGAQQDAPFIEATLDGGRMVVNNLRFDLPNKVVIADMLAQPLDFDTGELGAAEFTPDVPLWTFNTIVGPTVIPPSGLLKAADGDYSELEGLGYKILSTRPSVDVPSWGTIYEVEAKNVFSGLKVTEEGFNIFAKGLGLTPGSVGFDALNNVNNGAEGWGQISSAIIFEAREVPEPSTYALMGLGLVGISLVARRRAK